MNKIQNEYFPESVSAPGETLVDEMAIRSISQAELSTRMGCSIKIINEIINGKTSIVTETALQLERVLGIPASFWIAREKNYREYLEKTKGTH